MPGWLPDWLVAVAVKMPALPRCALSQYSNFAITIGVRLGRVPEREGEKIVEIKRPLGKHFEAIELSFA